MSRMNQKLATIRNERLLNFLKNSVKEVFNEFDARLSETLEKWPGYSFINFMQALEENNLDLAIQIYDAIVYAFSFDSFCDWKEQHCQMIYSSNLMHKMNRLQELFREESEIFEGLYSEATPLFKTCMEKWAEEEQRSTACSALQKTFFAPQTGESVACCLERLWYVKRKGRYRNYSEFLKKWEHTLKSQIVVSTKFTSSDEAFFSTWKNKLFNEVSSSKNPLVGRWKGGYAIDSITASKIILYHIDLFMQKPHRIEYGEISCLLWLLIFLSKSKQDNRQYSLKNLLDINSKNLKLNRTISFQDDNIQIPIKLAKLLSLLQQCGNQNKLFQNINIDTLPDALKRASKNLGIKKEVLPQAFLANIHPFGDLRILPWLSKEMMEGTKPERCVEAILKPYGLPTQCFLDMPKPPPSEYTPPLDFIEHHPLARRKLKNNIPSLKISFSTH